MSLSDTLGRRASLGILEPERLATALFAVFALTLIPVWINLVEVGFGTVKPFHLVGLVLLAAALLSQRLRESMFLVVTRNVWLFAGFALVILMYINAIALYQFPFVRFGDLIRQLLYASLALAAGSVFVAAERPELRRMAIALGFVAPFVAVGALFISLYLSGASPLALVARAFATGDSDVVLFAIFRRSFQIGLENPEEAQANLRHNLMSAILVSMLLSLAYAPHVTGRLRRPAYLACVGLGLFVVIFSLSRAVTLAMIATVATKVFIEAVRGRMSARFLMLLIFLLATVAIVIVSPLGPLLAERFLSETRSYETRASALAESLEQIRRGFWFGLDGLSPHINAHNLLIDSWRGAGIFAALGALIFMGSLAFKLIRETLAIALRRNYWRLSLDPAFVLGLGILPLVRTGTAGNGRIHMTEWLGIGLLLAILTANELVGERRAARDEDP